MAYDSTLPLDNTAGIRENFRALKEDKIVAAESANTADSATTAASCIGNSATATQLAKARTISLTGNATGNASFDGSADVSITVDVTSADTAAACSGNATTATKLETARTINGVSFDGTADITISTDEYDKAHLFSANGYQELGNGLILQWGSSNLPASGTTVAAKTVTFPIAFPNACLQAFATAAGAVNTASGYVPVMICGTLTATSASFGGDSNGTVKFTNTPGFNWLAIGY
ncbi:Hypothetical protein LUCI_0180 [Lucifera butyrica]|uniref:Putative tail fiber protein gp53-like C-terminal domain-containing protein n=1 Tax=Lucifera butyrica TaxID=1351585 RepID=A0A498R0F1_9FIRM|nr:hypothetical protein [Lucifera butyrica]VBB04974.1 Hypothetical protein LUCI_0180 [Lucifera butyrica]